MNATTGLVLQLSDPTYRDRGSTEIHGVSGKSYTFAYSDWFGFQVMYVKDAKEHEETLKDIYGEEFHRESMYKYGIVTRYLTPEQTAQMAEADARRQATRQREIDTANAEVDASAPGALKEWEETHAKAKAKLEYAEKKKESGEVKEHDVEGKKALDAHIATLQQEVTTAEGQVKRLQGHLEEIATRKAKAPKSKSAEMVTIPDQKELARLKAEKAIDEETEAAEDAKGAKAAKDADGDDDDDRKSPGGRSRR